MSTSLSFFSSTIFLSNPKSNIHSQKQRVFFKPLTATTTIRSEAAATATIPILSFDGTEVGSTTLNIKSAPLDTARAVVHRGLTTDLRNARAGTASTLTRAQVRGGGIKPYPQKKTGRARQGSKRTPLRPGGGVVFGPKPKDWSVKINKKEKRLAISTALSSAVENAIVVEEFGDKFDKPKTKEFIELMRRWGLDPKEKALFLMTEIDENVILSSRNIRTLKMLTPRTLNLFDILDSEKCVLTKSAVEFLNERYGNGNDNDNEWEFEEQEEDGGKVEESAESSE
ncbi:large ribosomal subunit protein uL4c isoform X1 [Lycium ferocissimum]|uniref:large ribosomal subunit protein uL4c isoform X1 n=1 Tax=Lycium ferocissimum TaxID=112874 RepID=UPI002815040D|nr:large ribosomal subunit protein uL4c isoform X1 [Lycium ferocissimum]